MPGATSFADVPENRTRVVIVDADHRVREGVVAAIELAGGLEVVGQAGYLLAAVSLIAETSPDVVILDPRLPDVDGGNVDNPKKFKLRWTATDPNDDELTFRLYFRKDGWKGNDRSALAASP